MRRLFFWLFSEVCFGFGLWIWLCLVVVVVVEAFFQHGCSTKSNWLCTVKHWLWQQTKKLQIHSNVTNCLVSFHFFCCV